MELFLFSCDREDRNLNILRTSEWSNSIDSRRATILERKSCFLHPKPITFHSIRLRHTEQPIFFSLFHCTGIDISSMPVFRASGVSIDPFEANQTFSFGYQCFQGKHGTPHALAAHNLEHHHYYDVLYDICTMIAGESNTTKSSKRV